MDQQNAHHHFQVECTNELLDGTKIIGITAEFRWGPNQLTVSTATDISVTYAERISVYSEHRGGRCSSLTVTCLRPNNQIEVKHDRVQRPSMGQYARYGDWRIRPAQTAGQAALMGHAPIELVRLTS